MEGETCTQCWVGALQLHEGMLVCEVCGSIAQGFAEETQEYQTGISDARHFKKSEGMQRGKAAAADAAEPPPPPPVGEAVRAYVSALQQLLQRQARTLIDTFGMDPALSPLLRELWLALLAGCRVLEPGTLSRLEALAEQARAAAPPGHGGEAAEEEDAGRPVKRGRGGTLAAMPKQMMYQVGWSAQLQRELGRLLRPQQTLFLVLLACWRQQEAASPLDLCRWALDGHLPYLSFPAVEGRALERYRLVLGGELLSVKGAPSPAFILEEARRLAAQLGLACPPLDAPLWVERYLAELDLPQELLPVALQLQAIYRPAPLPPTHAGPRLTHHPWAQLMAAVLVTVKLCYGLDGRAGGLEGLPPPPAWQDWAQRQLAKHGSVSAFPLSLHEAGPSASAAQLDEAGFRAYIQHLQQGVFASCAPPADLETAHRAFQQLALQALAGGPAAPGGAPAAGQQGVQQGQQRQQARQAQQAQQDEQDEQLGRDAYLYLGSGARGNWRAALLPPDYVAALAACSCLVWLTPEGLHEVVDGLERSMIAAECDVSYRYNAEEQERLARVEEEALLLRAVEEKLQEQESE